MTRVEYDRCAAFALLTLLLGFALGFHGGCQYQAELERENRETLQSWGLQ